MFYKILNLSTGEYLSQYSFKYKQAAEVYLERYINPYKKETLPKGFLFPNVIERHIFEIVGFENHENI